MQLCLVWLCNMDVTFSGLAGGGQVHQLELHVALAFPVGHYHIEGLEVPVEDARSMQAVNSLQCKPVPQHDLAGAFKACWEGPYATVAICHNCISLPSLSWTSMPKGAAGTYVNDPMTNRQAMSLWKQDLEVMM